MFNLIKCGTKRMVHLRIEIRNPYDFDLQQRDL